MYWRSNEKLGSSSQKIGSPSFWPLALPGRYFLPYFGAYDCRIAHRRLDMLPMRKLGATNVNLWTDSKFQKPEVLLQMPEKVRIVIKFTVIRKMRHK